MTIKRYNVMNKYTITVLEDYTDLFPQVQEEFNEFKKYLNSLKENYNNKSRKEIMLEFDGIKKLLEQVGVNISMNVMDSKDRIQSLDIEEIESVIEHRENMCVRTSGQQNHNMAVVALLTVPKGEEGLNLSTNHTSNLNKEFQGKISKHQYHCHTFIDSLEFMHEK